MTISSLTSIEQGTLPLLETAGKRCSQCTRDKSGGRWYGAPDPENPGEEKKYICKPCYTNNRKSSLKFPSDAGVVDMDLSEEAFWRVLDEDFPEDFSTSVHVSSSKRRRVDPIDLLIKEDMGLSEEAFLSG